MAAAACDPRYDVRYRTGGVDMSIDSQQLSRVEWAREIDQTARAKTTHILKGSSDDCCHDLALLEPWLSTITVTKNGGAVWYGWVSRVHYFRDRVEVEAVGALQWLRKRVPTGYYKETADLADHFAALWALCMEGSDVGVEIVPFPTGVVELREMDDRAAYRTGWSIFREMADTGLDAVEFGNQIYAGDLTAIVPTVELGIEDFRGDVALTKDGELYANQGVVDGARSVNAVYPSGLTYPGAQPYPRIVDVIIDEQLQDITSARAAAKARVDYSPVVPRIVKATQDVALDPNSSIKPEALLPGGLVNLDTTGLCYAERESYRLGRVSVIVEGGAENTTIGLQPVGTLSALEGYSFEDDFGTVEDPIEEDGA